MDEFHGNFCSSLNYSMDFEHFPECFDNFTYNETDLLQSMSGYEISNAEYAAVVIYITFSFLALIGNAVVLRLLYKRGKRRTVFDVTVGSLVVADLCTAAGFFASTIAFLVTIKKDEVSQTMDKFLTVSFEFTIFCFVVSILHVILITTERLYALFSPLKYRQMATKKRARVPIALIWVASLTGTLVHALGFKRNQSDKAIGWVITVSSGSICIMYSIVVVKMVVLKRKSMFKSKKDSIVMINALAVTVSFLACLLPLAFGVLGVNSPSGSLIYLLSSFVAIKLLLDPVLFFYVSFWKVRRETQRRMRLLTVAAFSTTSFIGSTATIDRASRINSTTSNKDCDLKPEDVFATLSKSREFRRYKKTISKIYK